MLRVRLSWRVNKVIPPSGGRSGELQAEIDRLADKFGVRSIPVGLRTNHGLNVFVADDGSYHHSFCERGNLGFEVL